MRNTKTPKNLPGTIMAAVTIVKPAPKKSTAVMAKAIFLIMSIAPTPPDASGSADPMSMTASAVLAVVAATASFATSTPSATNKEGTPFHCNKLREVVVAVNDGAVWEIILDDCKLVVNASTTPLVDKK